MATLARPAVVLCTCSGQQKPWTANLVRADDRLAGNFPGTVVATVCVMGWRRIQRFPRKYTLVSWTLDWCGRFPRNRLAAKIRGLANVNAGRARRDGESLFLLHSIARRDNSEQVVDSRLGGTAAPRTTWLARALKTAQTGLTDSPQQRHSSRRAKPATAKAWLEPGCAEYSVPPRYV